MSPASARTATTRSPLRRAVLLLTVLAAVLVGTVCAGQAAAHAVVEPASTAVSQPDPDGPCLPHPDLPEHSARAVGAAFSGTDLADGDAHASAGPDRFAVRAVAMPVEHLPAAETGRLLAVLCVWRT
ncbi:hypothetical protein AB0I28_30715 [Phytomonospora sp. NPDC050363]|uniref:hypothetical protein n=1 Tax=Phytomonospora sp. NPDC050363 TaxID=3155642 RepID=UPI00340A638B